ncbi:unnamed protein product [Paramecium sonneborni]|uniref:Uncharacterized protein n=1 Tax=Paramecium sonneborni TaxID=65129 RepID=A0A8S1KHZ3_9CILI|nr:unnamed protein product [Paramecium sonneborni]
MSKITSISQKTSSQIESSSQNLQSQGNGGRFKEEFEQMERQIKNSGGSSFVQQYSSVGGENQKNFQEDGNIELETQKFESSQAQNSQFGRLNGNSSSMRQNGETEENGSYEGVMQSQGQSFQNAQTSSSSHQASYQTQTIVTKTITTSHRISQSGDQGEMEAGGYEMMNGQGSMEGEAYGSASAQYIYGGYNLQANHASLEGGLSLNKYNFSNASLKEKQFNSSSGKVQMACEAAMAAALRKQEEAAAAGGAMASWELQMKAMAELKAQYQLSAKITVKQRSFLMYGYGFRGKDAKPQKCDDEDLNKQKCDDEDLNKNKCDDVEQEKPKEGLNFAVCEAECIEKPKKKKPEDLNSVPQDAEEFTKKKKPNGPEEQPCEPEEFNKKKKPELEKQQCDPEDLSKSKNKPTTLSPNSYFKPRSEDYIRLIPRSPSQVVYPVSSVRNIIMPQLVTCEPVHVAKQPILTTCLSVRQPIQPVIIQEEVVPTILQGVQYGTPRPLRQRESFQPIQQQLVAVQPQTVQQQTYIQVQAQPTIQQQIVQVQEMQPLQQVVMVQPIHKAETYSQQLIQVQQPHAIGQAVQITAQQNHYASAQTIQLVTQQPQTVTSVAQPVIQLQAVQQEMIPQVAMQQQLMIPQMTLQNQITSQPQVVLQPTQQQQTMVVQTQPVLQSQTIQMQQPILQIQPQQTIQIQQTQQVTSPLRQQQLVLQSQIPLNYSTQPIELLQRSQSPTHIPVGQQQFKFQNILHKV